ncbi:Helix-turn-helix domain [Phytophthora infestans]|uniref:Helix-turn-helix domain n=1 Tax=Phytophthora infestans TaxID=4787 RepID=A0A833STF7_PHYIN|nr:Helix-turn-helix domain [Phytophthora infestans]KAF4141788.1 Helix-turn-helix domain [Phytophthora infestans]
MPKYVSSAKVRAVYDINPETLRGWAVKGVINARAITNPSGRKTWMYDLESIGRRMEPDVDESSSSSCSTQQGATVLYCRVSSNKQVSDLERQQGLLSTAFPDSEVITDIDSGLNYSKPGLTKLVEMVCQEQIGRVVVTFKDRLMRFGYELFEKMCKEHTVKIVVYADEQRETERRQKCLEDSGKNKESPNSVIKIKVYPTKEEKTLLTKMFGTHRAIYNKLVESSRGDCYKLNKKELAEKYRGFSQKHSIADYLPTFHSEVPEETMDSTYRDFVKATESSKALYKV